MAKYFKIQSIILCLCLILTSFSGISALAADLELVSWNADGDFITLDFNQEIDTTNSVIVLEKNGEEAEFTFAKNDISSVVQTIGSSRYTYLVTPEGGMEIGAEYKISLQDVKSSDGTFTLEQIEKKFAVVELANDADLVDMVPYKYLNAAWNKDEVTGKLYKTDALIRNLSNMQTFMYAGALIGADKEAGNKLPNAKSSSIGELGTGTWTEKDYTVKVTFKTDERLGRSSTWLGMGRNVTNMHGNSAATDITAVSLQGYGVTAATAQSMNMYLIDGNTGTKVKNAVVLSSGNRPKVTYDYTAGIELKLSTKGTVAHAFVNGKKAMDAVIDGKAGYPFFAWKTVSPGNTYTTTDEAGNETTATYTSTSVELYGFQVTQCREISGTELSKTENVEVRDTLEVRFENAIDPATKDDIKIIAEGGAVVDSENYTVTLSDGDTVATIAFVERLDYETNYTIDFDDVKVAENSKMLISDLAFRTKNLPPQSPELLEAWDADFEEVTITFSEEIAEFDATLTKNGVEIEELTITEGSDNVYTIAPADGSGIEEGVAYEIKIENVSNAGDTKALLIWSKEFKVVLVEGEANCYELAAATLNRTEGVDISDALEITFDKAIEPASVEGIKLFVKGGEEVNPEDYEVSLSPDGKVATIAFENLAYTTDYDITFEPVMLQGAGLALVDSVSFKTKDQPKAIEEILIDWNADLDFITLDFSEAITNLTAVLKKGNATVPVTFVPANREDSSSTDRFTYKIVPTGGIQKNAGYKLTISDIDCASELFADDTWTINFKVELLDDAFDLTSTTDTYVYSTNGTVSQHEDGKGLKIQYEADNRVKTMISHAIGEDTDATKSIGSRDASSNGVYTHKDYTFKATFKNISGTPKPIIGIAHTYSPVSHYGYDHSWFRGIGTYITVSSTSSLRSYSQTKATKNGVDGAGETIWIDAKETVSDSSIADIDVVNGVELKLAMKGENANFFIDGEKAFDIKSYGDRGAAAIFFNPNDAASNNAYAEITDLVVTRAYEICEAEIEKDADVELSGSVKITLAEALAPAEANKIKLTEKEGAAVPATISLSEDGKEVTVSFTNLAYETVYTVNFADVTLESGKSLADFDFMTIYPPTELDSFGVAGGGALEGTVNLEAVIANNTQEEEFKFTATIAIYNSKGQMVKVVGEAHTLELGEQATISLPGFVCDSEETYTAKCFVWDSLASMGKIFEEAIGE